MSRTIELQRQIEELNSSIQDSTEFKKAQNYIGRQIDLREAELKGRLDAKKEVQMILNKHDACYDRSCIVSGQSTCSISIAKEIEVL